MSLPEVKTILYTTSLSKYTRPVFLSGSATGQRQQCQDHHASRCRADW